MKEFFTVAGAVVIILLLIVIGPLITLYAINILLESLSLIEIPYTISTWFAFLLLNLTFSGAKYYGR